MRITQDQLQEIVELLPKCPKVSASLPCEVANFIKVMPFLDDKILHLLHKGLVLESKAENND